MVTVRIACAVCNAAKPKGHRVDRCQRCARHKCKTCACDKPCGARGEQLNLKEAWSRSGGTESGEPSPAPASAAAQAVAIPQQGGQEGEGELQPSRGASEAAPATPAGAAGRGPWRSGRAQRQGVACDHCRQERGRNCSVWTCECCGTLLCPACRRKATADCSKAHNPAAVAGDTLASGGRAPLPAAPEADAAALEVLLEQYCAEPAPRTMQWCSRQLRGRVASQLTAAIAAAVVATQLSPGTKHELEAHRWAWAMPSLLLRAAENTGTEGSEKTAATTQMVRRRLQLAESSQWLELLEDALRDREEQADRTSQEAPRQGPAGEGAARLREAQASVSKARSGNLRGGIQVLTGEGVAEGTTATEEVMRGLVLEHCAAADGDGELEEQLRLAREEIRRRGGPPLRMRALRRRLRCLRAGAAPGASGWRNSHIGLVADDPVGQGWLLEWCRLWAMAAMPLAVANLWSRGVLVPLRRPDGKLRPIALTEALTKLAESAVVDAVFPQLRNHFHGRQFSVREPAGAEVIVGAVRQAAWLRPADAVVATDLSNAYGSVSRARTLRAVREACPQLLGVLVAQWEPGATTAWLRTDAGEWRSWPVERGLWQGSPCANPAFCCPLQRAIDDALAQAKADAGENDEMQQELARLARLAYADDAFFMGSPAALCLFLVCLSLSLGDAGWTLVWEKSHAWVPALDGNEPAQDSDEAKLFTLVTRAHDGLPLLGSAADGAFATVVATDAVRGAPALKRAEAAAGMCAKLRSLLVAGLAESPHQPVWMMLSRSAARRLDYDARVCPAGALERAAELVDGAVEDTFRALLGVRAGPAAMAQTRLPGPLGGLGLRGVRATADAHYVARVRATASRVIQLAGGDCFVDEGPAAEAAARLSREWGVVLQDGQVALTPRARAEAEEGPWLREWEAKLAAERAAGSQPPERLAGRILAAMELMAATRLWTAADAGGRARLLEAGGPGVGTAWTAMPDADRWMSSAQWRVATQLRLGLWNDGHELRCQHQTTGGVCGAPLGRGPLHSLDCQAAPSRVRIHKSLAVTLADQARRAQAEVALEQAVPELGRWWRDASGAWQCQDAVMDLVVGWPGAWLGKTLVDVTMRDPQATRYQPAASRRPGASTAKADEEKQTRYPQHHGAVVRTLAFEPLGRLGDAGIDLLADMAADAAAVAADRTSAPALRRRWRQALEHTLVTGVADAVLRAAGRVGAQAWERGAAPRLGRTAGAKPRAELTEAQLDRAAANRLRALERRAARLEAAAAAAADPEDAALRGRGGGGG